MEVFGAYELIQRIAVGGMAEVFLARQRGPHGFERTVALKRILPHFSSDPDFVRMFVDEAVLAGKLSHPNIAQIYDFGAVGETYFIAMEYIDGADLRKIIRNARERSWPMSQSDVATIGEGVALGLSHAHNYADPSEGPLHIVHRDISPHNIMISRAGVAKVMDFGIAKALARANRTATGTVKGKIPYMAPEQAAGETIDKRTDQFALGVVLWECLVGHKLFEGDSEADLLRRVIACNIVAPSSLRADVQPELEAVLMRCLERDPAKRFDDLNDCAAAFFHFRQKQAAGDYQQLASLVSALGPPATVARPRTTLPLPEASATPAPTASTADLAVEPKEPSVEVAAQEVSRPEVPSSPSVGSQEFSATHSPWRPNYKVLVGASVLAVVVAAVMALRQPSNARVHITSVPPGAKILLRGLDTGLSTPVVVEQRQGKDSVAVVLERQGYQAWSGSFVPNEPEVFVAGELSALLPEAKAIAPIEDTNVEPTEVEPTVAAPAPTSPSPAVVAPPSVQQKRKNATKAAAKDAPKSVVAAQTGFLSLRVMSGWADVYLGTRKLGTTPLANVELPVGTHRLVLRNDAAKQRKTVEVVIEAGEERRQTVSLQP